jgi:hypothetical protein
MSPSVLRGQSEKMFMIAQLLIIKGVLTKISDIDPTGFAAVKREGQWNSNKFATFLPSLRSATSNERPRDAACDDPP